MFCAICKCEYAGWRWRCPICRSSLIEALPTEPETIRQTMPYDQLVDLAKARGRKLEIEVVVSEVSKEKERGFPIFAYGFAWT